MVNEIELYKTESARVFASISTRDIEDLTKTIIAAYENGNWVYACGNGGNAAYVANLVTDLNIHPFVSEDKSKPLLVGRRLFAVNLCESGSTLTGILNDFGAEHVFSEQLKFGGKTGDVLISITGSGGSPNIVRAMETARTMGMKNVLLTKNVNGKAAQNADLIIVITGDSAFPGQTGKNNNNFHFEDCLSKLSHIATGLLKQHVAKGS